MTFVYIVIEAAVLPEYDKLAVGVFSSVEKAAAYIQKKPNPHLYEITVWQVQ